MWRELSHVNVIFISLQGYPDENHPFFKRIEILIFDTHQQLSAIISPHKFVQCHSSGNLLIFIGKNLWFRVLEANKKQVPPKSYSLKIRIDSVKQILKNKEKIVQTCNINILTRITDWKIPCVYTHVYHIIKNREPGLYNYLHHTDTGLSMNSMWSHLHVPTHPSIYLGMLLLHVQKFIWWVLHYPFKNNSFATSCQVKFRFVEIHCIILYLEVNTSVWAMHKNTLDEFKNPLLSKIFL